MRLKLAAMAGMVGVAIPLAAVVGMVGVAIPLAAGRKRRRLLSTESGFFALAKAFVGGVILATGFVLMLHDAEAALTDPYLPRFPWRSFPFSDFVAMATALATLVLDLLATQFYERKHRAAAAAETDAAAEDDEERSIITAAPEPPVDEDEDEGSAKGGDAVHIVGMRAHAATHGHNHHYHGHAHGHAHAHTHGDGDEARSPRTCATSSSPTCSI
uniref:Uncharacterized protein n=1 Tax=Ananas comosus var. bracteatus TaxID=296719 RepID=A0A6V7QRF2_ANACO